MEQKVEKATMFSADWKPLHNWVQNYGHQIRSWHLVAEWLRHDSADLTFLSIVEKHKHCLLILTARLQHVLSIVDEYKPSLLIQMERRQDVIPSVVSFSRSE